MRTHKLHFNRLIHPTLEVSCNDVIFPSKGQRRQAHVCAPDGDPAAGSVSDSSSPPFAALPSGGGRSRTSKRALQVQKSLFEDVWQRPCWMLSVNGCWLCIRPPDKLLALTVQTRAQVNYIGDCGAELCSRSYAPPLSPHRRYASSGVSIVGYVVQATLSRRLFSLQPRCSTE